jgi:hypothetical protein
MATQNSRFPPPSCRTYFTYNLAKIHRTLRATPAATAGVTERLWKMSDLLALLEAEERGLGRSVG